MSISDEYLNIFHCSEVILFSFFVIKICLLKGPKEKKGFFIIDTDSKTERKELMYSLISINIFCHP